MVRIGPKPERVNRSAVVNGFICYDHADLMEIAALRGGATLESLFEEWRERGYVRDNPQENARIGAGMRDERDGR